MYTHAHPHVCTACAWHVYAQVREAGTPAPSPSPVPFPLFAHADSPPAESPTPLATGGAPLFSSPADSPTTDQPSPTVATTPNTAAATYEGCAQRDGWGGADRWDGPLSPDATWPLPAGSGRDSPGLAALDEQRQRLSSRRRWRAGSGDGSGGAGGADADGALPAAARRESRWPKGAPTDRWRQQHGEALAHEE